MNMKRWMAGFCSIAAAMTLLAGCSQNNSTAEVEQMKKQLDTLQKYIEVNMKADLENWDGSYVGVGDYRVHQIVDDTPIIEAYKSGDDSALDEEQKFTLDKAKEVLEQLHITDAMSDYEKEKAIYDWQVMYVKYDESQQAAIPSDINIADYNYYPYGVLKYHQAICVGNATTFKLFMDMLGIDCKIIHSTTQGEHAWNLVKLEDGWYHVDVTFDTPSANGPSYSYFNVPDSVKQNSGYPWNAEDFPAADATKYCYALQNAVELADLYELPKAVKDGVDAQKGCIFVSFADGSVLDYNVTDMISPYVEGYYVYAGNTYSFADGTILYSVTLDKTVDSVTPEEPPYDYDKMQKKIEEVFGVVAMG